MAVTAHWIDEDWKLRKILLDFPRFPSPHTSSATFELFWGVIEEWEISSKIHAITIDNVSDFIGAVSKVHAFLLEKGDCKTLSGVSGLQIRCTAYVINLSVKECFMALSIELSNLRSLISTIHHSTKKKRTIWHYSCWVGSPTFSFPPSTRLEHSMVFYVPYVETGVSGEGNFQQYVQQDSGSVVEQGCRREAGKSVQH